MKRGNVVFYSLIVLVVAILFLFIYNISYNQTYSGNAVKNFINDVFFAPKGGGGTTTIYACNDHIDNDGDGYCDVSGRRSSCSDGSTPGDPGCSSKSDYDEYNYVCQPSIEICDGRDNDCDGLIDENNVCFSQSTCVELFKGTNDVNADRINVVFVGLAFQDVNSFVNKATQAVDYYANTTAGGPGLLELSTYKTNKGKFNFWYVPKIFTPIGDPSVSCSYCQNSTSNNYCGGLANKYVANLCDSSFRSCAYFGGASHNSVRYSDWPYTFDHEFEHQFARLADEYTDTAGTDKPRSPNCAGDLATAQLWWAGLVGQAGADGQLVGYYDGCSYVGGNYRSAYNTIMRSRGVYGFGLVNENAIASLLSGFAGSPVGEGYAMEVTLEGDPTNLNSYQITEVKSVTLSSPVKQDKTKKNLLKIKTDKETFEQGFDTYDLLIVEDFGNGVDNKEIKLVKSEEIPLNKVKVLVPLGKAKLNAQTKNLDLPSQARVPFDIELLSQGRVVKEIQQEDFQDKIK
ncbi:MAG: M64 family metallopeptidase [Nanoarchaeota archaeon]|nr:M64 family metallopeptidase [Nanoarchaeota archaeon]